MEHVRRSLALIFNAPQTHSPTESEIAARMHLAVLLLRHLACETAFFRSYTDLKKSYRHVPQSRNLLDALVKPVIFTVQAILDVVVAT